MPTYSIPTIPTNIIVHLGRPDQPARNITVPFIEYIKNVASSEIYPTWPESAIRANILSQITFALNRVYTEWYRSRGYDFDITNSTQYDQFFVENRDIFDNISKIVDDIFNNYVVRQGSIAPYFTQYCNGTTSTCDGLSQWGTVELANRGMVPYEILQYYYGDDINIVFNAPVQENIPSYPGVPLRLGSAGEDVRTIQRQLNRIGDNYPAIPRVSPTDGIFNLQTDAAVRKFQQIFNLTADGIVGKATWYKIKYIYNGVKNLGELTSEGVSLSEADRIYATELKEGDSGNQVRAIQYYLAVIGYFDDRFPFITPDGFFGPETAGAVRTFQQAFGMEPTGVVDRDTWYKISQVYDDIIHNLPQEVLSESDEIYPGRNLSLGMTGDDVQALQRFLVVISQNDPAISPVTVTGTFDSATEAAVREIQRERGLPVNGVVGPLTWARVVALYQQYEE
ncbi:peptidoglycan-binding protein [Zongyangia hominis]|uniref:Peptidoglycan-binding protein n=1 Tax=Zongyangia hominis TaxID=2763677 RepID=A0A926I9M9_9FIRM|nr:peptidoglycan-binding protein [Zongyangia hominis]MBC8569326.1 peptidoglycan-binding protein [Zongyangia hominis]